MTLYAPLPHWRTFLALTKRVAWKREFAALFEFSNSDVKLGWLSRSAWSLALIVLWRLRGSTHKEVSVWIPDYFCNQSLAPIRALPIRLHFYRINGDCSPDYTFLRQDARCSKPDIFILVHYFGVHTPCAEALEFCRHHGAWLVEDASHLIPSPHGPNQCGDFKIFSPHKLLPSPDGAVLMVNGKGPSKLGSDFLEELGEPRQWPRLLHGHLETDSTVIRNTTWIFKRLLQKLGIRRRIPLNQDGSNSHQIRLPHPKSTAIGRQFILEESAYLTRTRDVRIRNKLLWDYVFSNSEWAACLRPCEAPGSWYEMPYMARFYIETGENVFDHLKAAGYPVTKWPDLPPEVELQPERHREAILLWKKYIFLPVHQSLNARDLLRHISLPKSGVQGVDLQKHYGSADEWNSLLKNVRFSNLLQSWEFGSAKRDSEGWSVDRFCILYQGRVVGLFQILTRSMLGFLSVHRLNRGPLFFEDTSVEIQKASIRIISKTFGNLCRGHLLLWAPELEFTGANHAMLYSTGFRLRQKKVWSSSFIDITVSGESLLGGTSGKWRNSLRDAERKPLEFRVSESDADFSTLVANCADLLGRRDAALPQHLYLQYYKTLSRTRDRNLLLVAYCHKIVVASIYVVTHGRTATYLLGWNSEDGRLMRAHHLLLWNAVHELKSRSIRYFDLGGVDWNLTPGIAAFKLGMGGRYYRLVGEGVCF